MAQTQQLDRTGWILLLTLSILWGGSFFFAEVALQELPPLTIVFARVGLGAIVLFCVVSATGAGLPRTLIGWRPLIVMGLLNNVVPFTLIVAGQIWLTGGLASIFNATTPFFAMAILALTGDEMLTRNRVLGLMIGFAGVVVLVGGQIGLSSDVAAGMALCILGAFSYGLAAWWGRRHLRNVPPLVSASGQLISSTVMIGVACLSLDRPWELDFPGVPVLASLAALAVFSTALAYLLFFSILARSGATNVSLVTLLIPVTAILLGVVVLGEPFTARELLGAVMVGTGLLVVDGRVTKLWARRPRTT